MTTEPEPEDRYREELLVLIGSFEFERCSECGKDIDRHVFSPDPLGHPHQFCLDDPDTRGGFELKLDIDNAAFDDSYGGAVEIQRIVNVVTERLMEGEVAGQCRDINGNTVGEWRVA